MKMKIDKGLFAGIEIDSDQLQAVVDLQNLPRFRADGSQMLYWPTNHRTPYFLEKFSPLDGWSVNVSSTIGEFTMPDRMPAADGSIVQQPTVTFVARLIKNGTTMAEASVLATIYGPKAWESGETIARGRLYDALGLSAPLSGDPEFTQGGNKPAPAATSASIPDALPKQTIAASEAIVVATPAAAIAPAAVLLPATVDPDVAITATATEQHPTANTVKIDANLLRTIKTQAAARQVAVPEFASLEDAKTFYKDLLRGKLTPVAGAA